MSDAGMQTPPVVPPAAPWFAAADDEFKGWLQTRGLDKREAPEAAFQLAKDYREAQQKLGIPSDRLLRLPADPADAAGWKAIHQKLGVPDDPAGYDFAGVKTPDGTALSDDMVAFLRSTAAALAIPKDRAPKLAEALLARAAEGSAKSASEAAIGNGQARLRLQQNWGPNAPNNKFVADRTAAMLGLPAALTALIETSPEYDTIMEGLRQAGERMGEANLIGGVGQGGGPAQVRTREQAHARIAELIRDPDFYKRRMTPGDAGKSAREEWDMLHRMAVQRG